MNKCIDDYADPERDSSKTIQQILRKNSTKCSAQNFIPLLYETTLASKHEIDTLKDAVAKNLKAIKRLKKTVTNLAENIKEMQVTIRDPKQHSKPNSNEIFCV